MKKFLLTICTVACLSIFAIGQTQKRDPTATIFKDFGKFDLLDLDNTCDSIGWRPPANYSVATQVRANNGGFFSGVNDYGDIAKGNFFDLSTTTASFLSRLIILVGYANGAGGGNLDKPIIVRVLDGSSGTPGAQITSLNYTLGQMRDISGSWVILNFPPNTALPASKKIFVAVDFKGLIWNTTTEAASKDTFLLAHTLFDEANPNLGWEQWENETWHAMNAPDAWNKTMNFHLYPLVSATADGCTLPVTFGGFTGKVVSSGINLNWQTWTELNNQRFEVERSTDALKFTAVGTVISKAVNGNHQGQLNYQFTDANPTEGVNYYRIRQIDKDGASAFTKVVKIAYQATPDNSIIRNYYPNPASDRLFIQLGAGIREVETVRFTDASGKILGTQKPAVSPDGVINVSTRNLRNGLNFATVILPDGKQTTIKVLKD